MAWPRAPLPERIRPSAHPPTIVGWDCSIYSAVHSFRCTPALLHPRSTNSSTRPSIDQLTRRPSQADLRFDADLRQLQQQLNAEREERLAVEQRAREAARAEAARLKAEAAAARAEAEEAAAKARALEIKVEFLSGERAELLADRDAARELLAAHEGDMDRLETQLKVRTRGGRRYRCPRMIERGSSSSSCCSCSCRRRRRRRRRRRGRRRRKMRMVE